MIEGSGNEVRERLHDEVFIAKDMDDAITIAEENPEFEYGTTARIEVRPIETKEETPNYVGP